MEHIALPLPAKLCPAPGSEPKVIGETESNVAKAKRQAKTDSAGKWLHTFWGSCIKRAIEPEIKAEAKERKAVGGKLKGKAPAKLADVKGQARDKVAKLTGKKRTSLAKAEAIVAAAGSAYTGDPIWESHRKCQRENTWQKREAAPSDPAIPANRRARGIRSRLQLKACWMAKQRS
jgi:hypothetical protein